MTKASAPGKIILFGEHAVVYGQPALAVPVMQVHADAEVLDIDRAGIWVNAPNIGLHAEHSRIALDDALGAVINYVIARRAQPDEAISSLNKEIAALTSFARNDDKGIEIKITSTIPLASGLGSGAAVSVAIIRALSAHLGQPFTDEQINEIAYEVEKIHHGTPSGIDNTVVTYGKPIFFTPAPSVLRTSLPQVGEKESLPHLRGQEEATIETLQVTKPFTIIIGDTGIPAPTKESVANVRKLWEQDKRKMEMLFGVAGSLAETARQAIEGGHPERLGPLMNENQRILTEMGVSSPELDRLVAASLNAGASGAKLSGGGRGGNMIALSTKENAPEISKALVAAGAKNVIVTEVS
jgi:mevalonate kinase